MRRIQRHQTKQAGDQPSTRQRQHPTRKDKRNLAPVNRRKVIVHQRSAHSSPGQTLRGRNRQSQSRRKQHRNRSAQLRRESARRRHLRDLVTQRPHDMESVEPEATAEKQTRDDEEPDRGTGFGVNPSGAESVV